MLFILLCNRLVQDVFTCMGASNARRKFGDQTTPRTCVIVVVIVLTPPENQKSSSFIFLSRTSSKNCSAVSNISKRSATNAPARPRIRSIFLVSKQLQFFEYHFFITNLFVIRLQMFMIALGGKNVWDLSCTARLPGWDCLYVLTRCPHSIQRVRGLHH